MDSAVNFLFNSITEKFGWLYLLIMAGFIVFIFYIAFSKYGNIRLGRDDERPEYSFASWVAMLFTAGIGVGLVFWGVAEPLLDYLEPRWGEPLSEAAMDFAISNTFYNWGIAGWICFSLVALSVAYMSFRKNKAGLLSSIFIPLVGEERVKGWFGKCVDILAIFAAVAGISTSIGLGVLQIGGGLNYLFGMPINNFSIILIIAVLTALFICCSISGPDKGIKTIAKINVYIYIALMIAVFIIGPKVTILNTFVNGLCNYIMDFIPHALSINPHGDSGWLGNGRIFYYGWELSWSPFVGIFIARISKGRTIRELLLGSTVVPSVMCFIWISIFGGTALSFGPEVAYDAVQNTELAFFKVMDKLPIGSALSAVTVVLLLMFLATSADSATYVLGMQSRHGNMNPDSKSQVVWGVLQGLLAIALVLAGNLKSIQTISIVAGFPFMLVLLASCFSIIKALKEDETVTAGNNLNQNNNNPK